MADNKKLIGKPDRAKVAGGEAYEVKYIAEKMGVTQKAVKEAIQKVGNGRAKIEQELKKAKK